MGDFPFITVATIKGRQWSETIIFKAIHVTRIEDILEWNDSKVDYLLFDYEKGGSGKCFDWEIIKDQSFIKKPFFIAGGLNATNVFEALNYHPYGVDVSGGIETQGKKDRLKMEEFVI